MQPVKAQFNQFVQFTENIDDRLLDFQIKQAYTKHLLPRFGNLVVAIYNQQDESKFEEALPELENFYTDYLLEYWILVAYRRFISQHGINVTQFGLTQTKDPEGTFDQVSEDRRAAVIRQISSDINVCETNIYRRLKDVNWTFDSVVYENPDTENRKTAPKKTFGINAIGVKDDDIVKTNNYRKYIQ